MQRVECTDMFLKGYFDTALFTTDEHVGHEDYIANGRADEMFPRIPLDFLEQARLDCERFKRIYSSLLSEAGDAWENGADFWYTRNGHGVGFWSRGYDEEIGNALTLMAESYREVCLDLSDSPEEGQHELSEGELAECIADYISYGFSDIDIERYLEGSGVNKRKLVGLIRQLMEESVKKEGSALRKVCEGALNRITEREEGD